MSGRDHSLRQGALIVHALPPSDRAWLLGQLGDGDRAALQPLLEELEALGIPADTALLDMAMQPAPVHAAPNCAAAIGDSLRAADGAALAALFEAEPDQMTARVLGMRDWPWREALLARATPQRRRHLAESAAVAAQASAGGAGARLDEVLLEVVQRHARLQSSAAGARADAGAHAAARHDWLARLIRRWGRAA